MAKRVITVSGLSAKDPAVEAALAQLKAAVQAAGGTVSEKHGDHAHQKPDMTETDAFGRPIGSFDPNEKTPEIE